MLERKSRLWKRNDILLHPLKRKFKWNDLQPQTLSPATIF